MTISKDKSKDISEEATEKINKLRKMFSGELPGKIDLANELWSQLVLEWSESQANVLVDILHKLAGSASIFGYKQVGEISRQLEELINQYLKNPTSKDVPIEKVALLMEALLSPSVREMHKSEAFQPHSVVVSPKNKDKTIYILEDNFIFAKTLATQLNGYGFNTSFFIDVDTFMMAIENRLPDGIIVDVKLKESESSGIETIRKLKAEQGLQIPALVFTVREDFSAKLEALRAGADSYFVKPVDIDVLVTELDRLVVDPGVSEPLRILIVDDDEALALHSSLILEQAGMMTKVVTSPIEACDAIGVLSPDLIVLDLYMPDCSGIELAGVIRFHPEYLHIPIVFLSSETETERKLAALKTGSDDFLTKPIDPTHFIEAIRIRGTRSRRMNEVAVHDSLTGLLNHSALKERLHQDFTRATRANSHFCFAMLDIDRFKSVNDDYGHLMGDRVISCLARMLKKRLRNGDVCARYGGEEFAVILPDCTPEDASKLLNKFREDFSQHEFHFEDNNFNVTVSVGIAHSKDVQTFEDLIQAADQALYKAKDSGRNQVMLYK